MRMRQIVMTATAGCLAWTWLAAGAGGAADEGFETLRKMAEQGDAEATRRIATAYDSGIGIPRDDGEAAKWYERAARLGDPDAQFRLGVLYREGRGVLRDPVKAYAWFDLAASNPHFLDRDDAATYRDEAARGMDAAELASAKALARTWQAAPPPERP